MCVPVCARVGVGMVLGSQGMSTCGQSWYLPANYQHYAEDSRRATDNATTQVLPAPPDGKAYTDGASMRGKILCWVLTYPGAHSTKARNPFLALFVSFVFCTCFNIILI